MFRCIKSTLAILKKEDPETEITEYFLRKLAKEGKVNYLQSGTKYLLDIKSLRTYLENKKEIF